MFVQELVASKCPAALFARAVLAIDGEISFFMLYALIPMEIWKNIFGIYSVRVWESGASGQSRSSLLDYGETVDLVLQ